MENTLDSVMSGIEKMAKRKGVPIDPHQYLDACEKINALLQGEQELLFEEEQVVANMRKQLLEEGKTASYTKMVVEASDEYRHARSRKSKIDRAIEAIRLGKIHARMSHDIYGSQR